MNPTENEKLGLGLNLIESLALILRSKYSSRIKSSIPSRIQVVVNNMDEVLC